MNGWPNLSAKRLDFVAPHNECAFNVSEGYAMPWGGVYAKTRKSDMEKLAHILT
jgi:hypothetical protein